MKTGKLVVICLIVAVAGFVLCGIGYLCGGRVYKISLNKNGIIVNSNQSVNGEGLSEYIDEDKELEPFTNLDIDIAFADFKVVESDHYGIEYHLDREALIYEEISQDTLKITQKSAPGADNEKSFLSIGIPFFGGMDNGQEYVIIHMPKGTELGTVSIKNASGDVALVDLQAENVVLENTFGSMKTEKINAKTVDINLEAGDFAFESIVSEELNIENRFGNIEGQEATAENIVIGIESGDCAIKDMSSTVSEFNSKFGSLSLGLHETVATYSVEAKTVFGSVTVNDDEKGTGYQNDVTETEHSIKMDSESGDIELYDAK